MAGLGHRKSCLTTDFANRAFVYLGGTANSALRNLKETPNKASAFCDTEATDLTARYEILHQYADNPDSNGFSATLFRDKATGHLVLGFRGTEFDNDPTRDLLYTDLRIGIDGYASPQAIAEYRYIKQLMTPAGQSVQYTEQELTNLRAIYWDYKPALSPDPQTALAQLAEWDALKARILADQGIDAGQGAAPLISSPANLSLTGHSLGGHLAMLATRLFPELSSAEVVTVNAAGFFPLVDTVLSSFSSSFGSNITRVESVGDGVSEIGGVRNNPLAFPGTTVTVGMETRSDLLAPFSANHSCANIADGLKLAELFGKLDGCYAADARLLKPLFDAGSAVPISSYEYLLDGLRNVILGAGTPTTVVETDQQPQTRDDFYQKLNVLAENDGFKSLAGKVAVSLSSADLASSARDQFSSLLSLLTLSPFVLKATAGNEAAVETALQANWQTEYTAWQTDIERIALERAAGRGVPDDLNYSDTYLRDRAAMLDWKVRFNQKNLITTLTDPHEDVLMSQWQYFKDYASGEEIVLGEPPAGQDDRSQILFGSDAGETLAGLGKDDHLYGGGGNDTLSGGDGADRLEGNAEDDSLSGGEGRDTLLGGTGADTLEGGKDNDLLIGGLGDDVYRYTTGDGYDTIRDADGKFSLVINGQTLSLANAVVDNSSTWKSEDGKHTFVATGDPSQGCTLIVDGVIAIENFKIDQGGLTLNPAKPVTSPSWSGGDTADLQASHAAIQDAGADTFKLNGLAGNDLLAGTDNHIWDPNNPGQWITTGQAIRDYLDGGQGKDWLFGDAGDDTLVGGSGDDLIIGGSGRDILDGGAENDLLMGFGAERYYAFLGRIEDGGVTLGPEDQDLERFLWSQIEFRFSLSSVELINDIETGRIRETHRIDLGGAVSGTVPAGISWYDEAAGRRFAPVAYEFTPAVSGSSRGDIVFTDDQGRTQSWQYLMGRVDATRSVVALDSGFGSQAGGIFNDPVDDSPDILQGAGGQDTLIGGGGNDTLVGGEDDDVLLSNGGADLLVGGGGKDFLAGGDGQDRLEGNGGDDTLYGEDADDLLDGGEGNDTLCGDFSTGRATGNGNDTLNGDDGNDWLYGNGGDDVLFGGKDDDKLFGDADDTPLTAIGNDTLDGGAGNDSLLGFGGDDRLDGGAGNDNLYGDVGNDVLLGGTGNDAMSGGEGNDILIGDSGDDGLWGDAGNDNLIGGDGDDDLTGGDGDDTLIGGSGTDCLNGGLGNDTYVLGAGDGALDATGSIEAINDVAGNNSLSFTNATAEGIACSSVNAGIDLRIDYGGDGHVLVVGGMHGAISRFVLADGTVWTNDDIRNQLLKGSSGNDVIMGASTDDHLHGQTGNDVLQGGIGNDTLSGDTGNDLLLGGEGTDLYVFNLGGGQDTLVDTIDGNIIRFGEAISRSSLQIADVTYLDETDSPVRAVSVRYGTTNDTLLIRDGLLGRIERFEFADGSSLSWRDVVAGLPSLNVVGSDGNDHAIGSSQNDTLVGAKGDDRLEGMGGDDYLVGGEGGNSYVWG